MSNGSARIGFATAKLCFDMRRISYAGKSNGNARR
uniref:Uncharacterized protein n=1 Tax=Ackermannviridae sp. ctQad106 TaxID=2826820 RepID=A0A8S5QMJ4_9CAUD|nr:MAG TPA: hypothetical protein [Ackermannviridae sp. ctQad106]